MSRKADAGSPGVGSTEPVKSAGAGFAGAGADAVPLITVGGVEYERIPVQTHLIHIKEPLEPVFDQYVKPVLQPGD